jgi:hypothetical protein
MATPSHDDQGRELLPDEEYNRIFGMTVAERAQLSSDTLAKFEATDEWHYQQRLSLDSLEGIDVGGMSVDEALAEARKPKD